MKSIYRLILVLSIIAVTPLALATEENICSSDTPANCLNGVGPAVTNSDTIRSTSSRFSGSFNPESTDSKEGQAYITSGQTGLAAGDTFAGWGIWTSYSRTDFDADLPINSLVQPIASYDADQDSVLVGADKLFMGKLAAGLALGYEDTEIATAYNGGNNETNGYTIAPYFAYLINDVFSVDAAGGYSSLSYDTDRIDNISGGTILGEFDADRWFVTANINATIIHNQWIISARAGYLYTEEEQDGYTETGPNTARTIGDRHIDLSQAIVGVNIAYSFGGLEPYAYIAYYNDLSRDEGFGPGGLPAGVGATQPDDDDEIQTSLGIRYFTDYISGTVEWTKVHERDHFDSNSVLLTIRVDL